jgi:shikimate dehydrogenase
VAAERRAGGRRAAVLGSPVAHSLSPVLHTAAYAELGLADWSYGATECTAAELPAHLAVVRDDATWVGLSLTMPLKEAVGPLVDRLDAQAERIGSANTVLRERDGLLRAVSTDVAGIAAALDELGWDHTGPVAVLGAGGTARAALAALPATEQVDVVARSPRRAEPVLALHPSARWVAWGRVEPSAYSLVVATVPAGVTDELARLGWPPGTALLDVLYDPWPTRLASAARASGAAVVGGLSVLVAQAAGQVELMTGRPAPVAVMRRAGERALAARS